VRRSRSNPCGRYVLGGPEGKTPVPEPDLMRWGSWFEQGDRIVALTGNDQIRVSTVFLAVDHNFGLGERSKPILFETMVFGGEYDGEMERYCTWEEAEYGHKAYVERVFGKALA
jgi:hypothetical protein